MLLAGDPVRQGARLSRWLRHRRAHTRLWRALSDYRWTTGLLLVHRQGLLDLLLDGPTSVEVSAAHCGIGEGAAAALLCLTEAQGLVARDGARFRLSDFGEAVLRTESPLTVRPMLEVLARLGDVQGLSDALGGRRGALLDIFEAGPATAAFLDAVNDWLDLAGRDLLARVALPKVRRLVVGSMGVSFSALVLDRSPGARVTYGCLPHLVAEVPRLCKRYGVDGRRVDGMHVHTGAPETDAWGEGFDVVFLTKKMILRPEERLGERFVDKACRVLAPGGRLVLWEAIHPERGPARIHQALDTLLDLGVSPGARPLPEGEVAAMLRKRGLVDVETIRCLDGQATFVVGTAV